METIGRYQVRHRLGAGAFATVWLGDDLDLDAPVAIKVLADNWAENADIRNRFVSEARLLRRITDNRVVRVHDIGELADGRPYFVMDYAEGGTLAEVVKAGMPPLDALRRGAEVARAVQVLHDAGVVHRDVKPSNLLLTRTRSGQERIVVADLGMAKSLAEASGLTVAAGSPAYMAPEQAHGVGGFDQRADVYAVAAVTYAMLTGRAPFDTSGGITSVVYRDPSAVPELVAARYALPPRLDEVLLAALAFDPEQRPSSAEQLAVQLDYLADRVERGEVSAPDLTQAPVAPNSLSAASTSTLPTEDLPTRTAVLPSQPRPAHEGERREPQRTGGKPAGANATPRGIPSGRLAALAALVFVAFGAVSWFVLNALG